MPIHLTNGQQVVTGTLEYSPAEVAMMIVLPNSGIFGRTPDERIKLDSRMLERMQLLPDGTLQLDWGPGTDNPPRATGPDAGRPPATRRRRH